MTTSLWAKALPRTNLVYMVISLLLVFTLDLSIVWGELFGSGNDGMSLLGFWFEMLGVIGIFGIFYYLENTIFAERFSNTKVRVDGWLYLLIHLRNISFVLNCVPFIQLIGIAFLTFAGIPLLLVYGLLIYFRFQQMKSAPASRTNPVTPPSIQ